MYGNRRLIIYCLLLSTLSFGLYGQTEGFSRTYTIEDITKKPKLILNGHAPTYHLYLPIKTQWRVEGLKLKLFVKRSPVLRPSSTLTLLIGDTPVDSIKLDFDSTSPKTWEVSIPSKDIPSKSKTLIIRIAGYMLVTDEICQDLENKGNWATISGDSRITYLYQKRPLLSLKAFPHPFIQTNAPAKDEVLFILPNEVTAQNFSPYLEMTNILSHKASWRGVGFSIKTIGDYEARRQTNKNTLLIGTANDFNHIDFTLPQPVRIANGRVIVGNRPLDDSEGVILLTPNPLNPAYASLYILSNTHIGLHNALLSLKHKSTFWLSQNPRYFIAKKPVTKPLSPTPTFETTQSFHSLGFRDDSVFGEGENSMLFSFNAPAKFVQNPAELTLIYSHSPFLDKDNRSFLYIKLNGQPMSGVALENLQGKKQALKMILPQKHLQIGKNDLTLVFDLNLKNAFCERYSVNSAWGTIYDASYLSFNPSSSYPRRTLNVYPYFLQATTHVHLPKEAFLYKDDAFLNILLNFIATLSESDNLVFNATNAQLNQNEIFISTAQSKLSHLKPLKNLFIPLFEKLQQTDNPTLKAINLNLFSDAFTENKDVGYLAIAPAPENENKTQLAIYGFGNKELKLALALLNHPFKRSQLKGNVAIAFSNGTYTSLDTQEIKTQIEKDIQVKEIGKISEYILIAFVVLGLIFIVGLILVVRSLQNK